MKPVLAAASTLKYNLRGLPLRQRISPGGAAGGGQVGFADEVPAGGSDAEVVVAGREVLLRAAEAAAAVVGNRVVRGAGKRLGGAVGQLQVLAIEQERDRQSHARGIVNGDAGIARDAAGQ